MVLHIATSLSLWFWINFGSFTRFTAAIERENEALRQQIGTLNVKLKQFCQMQELAGMLQQSHKCESQLTSNWLAIEIRPLKCSDAMFKFVVVFFFSRSLVTTNDHLLKELDETRRKHKDEMQKVNWSFAQMRRQANSTGQEWPWPEHNHSLNETCRPTHINLNRVVELCSQVYAEILWKPYFCVHHRTPLGFSVLKYM